MKRLLSILALLALLPLPPVWAGTPSQHAQPATVPISITDAGGKVLAFSTAPTITSGFGTGPSISASNTAAFKITIGSAPGSSGVIGMPTAAAGWACSANDVTTNASYVTAQSAGSTTSVTLSNYSRTTGLAASWTASDVLNVVCTAY